MGPEENAGSACLPPLRLDELLEELQVRITAVRGTRDRLHGLLEAVLKVGRALDLSEVLRRVVEAAVVLVDAEYGALGVIGEDLGLAEFITVGLEEERAAAIGPLPSGHGILGELIRHPEPLRLAELSDHLASYGFPANHPPMHSFLGVPIRVREEVFGNLYMTEKRGGREFDGEDEAVLSTLAVAAGVAIENARLYEEGRRREQWLEANAEVTKGLLSGMEESRALELIVEHARRILAADLGVLALPVAGSDDLRMVLASGREAEIHRGLRLPREGSFAGVAMVSGAPVTSAHIGKDPRVTVGPPRWAGLGPAVAVPMRTPDEVRGALILALEEGKPVFTPAQTVPLSTFADQAALAMELAGRRRDAERLALLADRDRIARDLHDLAIQRLFAAGMTLQSAMRFVQPEGTERVGRVVDDLDDTIKIIRSTIFGLRSKDVGPAAHGLRVRVAHVAEEAVPALGFTPSLRTEGLVDTDVPRPVADQVVAVLGEALSNVARHARATAADIVLVVKSGELTLTVSDNGVGMPEPPLRSGLRNLAQRAEELSGRLTIDTPSGGGTRLAWRVPVPRKVPRQ